MEQILRKESIYCIWSDCCELLFILHLPDEGESTIWELLIQYCENTVFLSERKKFHFIHLICFSFFPFLAKEINGGLWLLGILKCLLKYNLIFNF